MARPAAPDDERASCGSPKLLPRSAVTAILKFQTRLHISWPRKHSLSGILAVGFVSRSNLVIRQPRAIIRPTDDSVRPKSSFYIDDNIDMVKHLIYTQEPSKQKQPLAGAEVCLIGM